MATAIPHTEATNCSTEHLVWTLTTIIELTDDIDKHANCGHLNSVSAPALAHNIRYSALRALQEVKKKK